MSLSSEKKEVGGENFYSSGLQWIKQIFIGRLMDDD